MVEWIYFTVYLFFAQFLEELQSRHPATFTSRGGAGKSNKFVENLGYYPLFAEVAESGVFNYSTPFWKRSLTNFDKVLNTSLDEVFSFIEYKKALTRI